MKGEPFSEKTFRKKISKFARFSWLGQKVQFDTIKFRITFKNYFGQFMWIKKAMSTVALHVMKRRLKTGIQGVDATGTDNWILAVKTILIYC